jgi:hypothetical protein
MFIPCMTHYWRDNKEMFISAGPRVVNDHRGEDKLGD